jgi:hypothetical protein
MSQVRLIALQRAVGSVSKQLPLRPLTYRARAWDCAARTTGFERSGAALRVPPARRHVAGLTEPIEDDPAGAYEVLHKAAA